MAIDAMIPIGRGQRELIIGDRSTGKTTIGIDTIINKARLNQAPAAGNQRQGLPPALQHLRRHWPETIQRRPVIAFSKAGALPYTIVVVAAASDSATNQYLAPFAGAPWANGSWTTAWTR
jgi:F-type H+/Na+-transporting ATPase subunit alpha